MEFNLSSYFQQPPTSVFQLSSLLEDIEKESKMIMSNILDQLVYEVFVNNICELVKNSIDAGSTIIKIWTVEQDNEIAIVYFNDGQPFKNTTKLHFFQDSDDPYSFKSFGLILRQNGNKIVSPKREAPKTSVVIFGRNGLALKRMTLYLKRYGGDLQVANCQDRSGCYLKMIQKRRNLPFDSFQEFEKMGELGEPRVPP